MLLVCQKLCLVDQCKQFYMLIILLCTLNALKLPKCMFTYSNSCLMSKLYTTRVVKIYFYHFLH